MGKVVVKTVGITFFRLGSFKKAQNFLKMFRLLTLCIYYDSPKYLAKFRKITVIWKNIWEKSPIIYFNGEVGLFGSSIKYDEEINLKFNVGFHLTNVMHYNTNHFYCRYIRFILNMRKFH